jgi:hypothetical protein
MALITKLIQEVLEDKNKKIVWPKEYVNRRTGRTFIPQNEEVAYHIFESDEPRHLYIMSGEGAGKTAHSTILALEKLRRGLSGAIVCVDLPMLTKVWEEIKLWIPWDCVIPEHQHMNSEAWKPYKIFEIIFYAETGGYSKAIIGGLGDNYSKWESLNINWILADELRSVPKDDAIKIFAGRIRVTGPNGEPPQMIIASTPTGKNHWMFKYFGPIEKNDPLEEFKKETKIVRLSVEKNLQNLADGHIKMRGLTLTEAEKKVYIDGLWGDLHTDNRFVEDMIMWDRLYDPTIQLPRKKGDIKRDWSDALVLGLDAGVSRDYFAATFVSRHPMNREIIAVRVCKVWKPDSGRPIDFNSVEEYIRQMCREYNVIVAVYDPYQLHQLATNMSREHVVWMKQFSQTNQRLIADQQLFDAIIQERLRHTNDPTLREHVENANTEIDVTGNKRRIVKRHPSGKIDLCVALSQAHHECLRLAI